MKHNQEREITGIINTLYFLSFSAVCHTWQRLSGQNVLCKIPCMLCPLFKTKKPYFIYNIAMSLWSIIDLVHANYGQEKVSLSDGLHSNSEIQL